MVSHNRFPLLHYVKAEPLHARCSDVRLLMDVMGHASGQAAMWAGLYPSGSTPSWPPCLPAHPHSC